MGLAWLVAGGLAYTGGVFFFLSKRRRYTHFVWHLFVLLGTACHFLRRFLLRDRMNVLPNDTLPVEHNDPINARILAISEDKIAGFVREPFAEIAARSGLADRDRARAHHRDVARRDDPAGAPDIARHQSGRWRARRLESAAGKNRRGFRLDVAARSVFRPRCPAFDRRGHARFGI